MHIADDIDNGNTLMLLSWCNSLVNCLPMDKVNLGRSLWLILDVCSMFSVLHIYSTT